MKTCRVGFQWEGLCASCWRTRCPWHSQASEDSCGHSWFSPVLPRVRRQDPVFPFGFVLEEALFTAHRTHVVRRPFGEPLASCFKSSLLRRGLGPLTIKLATCVG